MPAYSRILADSDMDGLFGAAVLKAFRPDAEVVFSHAAELRSGLVDDLIDRTTVLVDLPFHTACGWYVDHHLTNRPSEDEAQRFAASGGLQHWEATPSAARLAYELLVNITDMRHLAPMMPVVDALDSGGITKEAFLADGPLLQLSRTCTSRDPDYMAHLVDLLTSGASMETLVADEVVAARMQGVVEERTARSSMLLSTRPSLTDSPFVGLMRRPCVPTVTWSQHGRVNEPMHVASFTGTQTVICLSVRAHRLAPVSTPTRSCPTAKGVGTSPVWLPHWTPRAAVTPMHVDAESSLRVLKPTWSTGSTCGLSERNCWPCEAQNLRMAEVFSMSITTSWSTGSSKFLMS